MADFEDIDMPEAQETLGKLAAIKVPWNRSDVRYWFFEIENQMELINIQSQWVKRCILANNLPEIVKDEVKELLKKPKSKLISAHDKMIYKALKSKVLKLFGKKEGDNYDLASQLMLTGKPSALAKKLTELLCECDPPLQCCATETVAALWRKRLPAQIRARIAGMSLKSDYDAVLTLADDVYASMNPEQQVAAVTTSAAATTPGEAEDVAAVRGQSSGNRGRGRWNGGRGAGRGRGQSRGGGGGQQRAQGDRGERHQDGPPEASCLMHWRWGRSAYYCTDPDQCPWRDECRPPKDKKKKQNNSST